MRSYEFAAEVAKSFPREDRETSLRKGKVPDWEKYVDQDIVSDIFDAWDDGTTSPGSTDVADVSWITPTMEFRTATNVNGAPGHSWQMTACAGTGIGHASLIFAAKTMAGSVLDLLTSPELLAKAREEQVGGLGAGSTRRTLRSWRRSRRRGGLARVYTGKSLGFPAELLGGWRVPVRVVGCARCRACRCSFRGGVFAPPSP